MSPSDLPCPKYFVQKPIPENRIQLSVKQLSGFHYRRNVTSKLTRYLNPFDYYIWENIRD